MKNIVSFQVIMCITVFHQTLCAVVKQKNNDEEAKKACSAGSKVQYIYIYNYIAPKCVQLVNVETMVWICN